MHLARVAPADRYYQEPWPFACPKPVYEAKRGEWLEAARILRERGSGRFGQRTAQIELMHLRNAYYRPPARPYPYAQEIQP
jgi:hypothetical protein